jgi:hypothetical protein
MFQMAGVNAFSWPISSVPADQIVPSILILRGDRVMLDSELANLYGVATNVLLQAVKRNSERFHEDFMLRLTVQEWEFLRSQSVTLNTGSGRHRKYLPHAFTEQGGRFPRCPQCYEAHERSRSMLRSCAPSFGCASCSPLTENLQRSSISSSASSSRMMKPSSAS